MPHARTDLDTSSHSVIINELDKLCGTNKGVQLTERIVAT